MPPAPLVAPPSSAAANTREIVGRAARTELLTLGRAGKPWVFLPLGTRELKAEPRDAELCFLVAANFARLHLRTAALETIGRLPSDAQREPGVAALSKLIDALSDDEVTVESRLAMCERNLEALALRGIDLSDAHRRWVVRADDLQVCRAHDGNVIRRTRGDRSIAAWTGLADEKTAAERFTARYIDGQASPDRPHTLEGIDPPWLMRALSEALPKRPSGSTARINIVQRDPIEALNGLSMTDLTNELSNSRVSIYLGEDAIAHLGADLRVRLHTEVIGPVIPLASTRVSFGSEVASLFRTLEGEQLALRDELSARMAAAYRGRDRSWWRRRFDEARSGHGQKLRVLVPTCRFSTFVKHSASDLAAALEAAGCEVRMVIEPDDTCVINTLAYLEPLANWQPDLIILINYTRATLQGAFGAALPKNLPFVCWVQDAMPHLFREETGLGRGEFDFVVGHLHKEFFERFGYQRSHTLAFPVVASERKFHCGPVDPDLARKHECEIAFASRHAETVEAMHGRLCREASQDPQMVRVLEHLYPQVVRIGEDPMAQFAQVKFGEIITEALVAQNFRGAQPDPLLVGLIAKQYCAPLAERAVRHQTLRWAADLAERNGWRMHIYGRGWEAHPRFSRYSRGELGHGEELRSSYRHAAVHLHASVHYLIHQRVLECVLSGGFPLIRLNMEEVSTLYWASVGALFNRGVEADDIDPTSKQPRFTTMDHPELCRWARLRQQLGLDASSSVLYSASRRAHFVESRTSVKPQEQALWLLGDSADNFFTNREQLEGRVTRALNGPEQRSGHSRFAGTRVRPLLTHAAFVTRSLDLVQRALEPEVKA